MVAGQLSEQVLAFTVAAQLCVVRADAPHRRICRRAITAEVQGLNQRGTLRRAVVQQRLKRFLFGGPQSRFSAFWPARARFWLGPGPGSGGCGATTASDSSVRVRPDLRCRARNRGGLQSPERSAITQARSMDAPATVIDPSKACCWRRFSGPSGNPWSAVQKSLLLPRVGRGSRRPDIGAASR